MKKIHSLLMVVTLIALLAVNGCSGFLDRETDSFLDKEMTFTSYERTNRFLINIYTLLPDGLNRIGSDAMYDAATDDAEHANELSDIQQFNTGSWSPYSNPDNLWNKYFGGIRMANEFLENVDKVNLDRYRLDPNNQSEYLNRVKDIKIWKAEARFLRAYFHFELLKRFGPVPIIKTSLSINENYTDLPRPTMDECVSFIANECDTAAATLELKPWRDQATALGRATKGAAMALKSRLLLYAASPLYLDWQNTSETHLPSDAQKWLAAAKAAKDVIDLNQYTLHNDYGALFQNAFQSTEYILMRRYGSSSNFETYNFPISYGGQGGINPSLNLVDEYEMRDGTSFSWNKPDDAKHPHFYRDSRLNKTMILNDSLWKDTKVEAWIGGKDGPNKANATKTGYYIKKYQNQDINLITGGGALGHTWTLFRLAEIYLNYAEALNEGDPGNPDIEHYLNLVRKRAGQPNAAPGLTQEEMRAQIRKERRVELAFEEHRAWDVRRWKIGSSTLGADLRGLQIVNKSAPPAQPVRSKIPVNEIPAGWHFYDGDEFNGNQIDNSYWGIYGDPIMGGATYGQPSGSIHTYRKEQVSIVTDGTDKVLNIAATRDGNPPASTYAPVSNRPGWWSGALSGRDTDKYGYPRKYYPLFSRIEIRAKVPYLYGIWMGLWARHYKGASTAELDIQEFFFKEFENTTNPVRLSQALHLHDSELNKLATNVNGYGRHTPLNFNPGNEYHVYGVQVEPDPRDPVNHAVVTYLLDGNPTSVFKTYDYGNRYNSFVTAAKQDNRLKTAWDVALTGQIGGPDNFGIGYPEDRDPNLRNVSIKIDWVRVFTRTEQTPDVPTKPALPTNEKFEYKPVVVEKRVFEPKMYWYPIPLSELLKMKGWAQNPGW